MILLSFDTEEFDVPREHGVDFSLEEGMKVSIEGTNRILDVLKQNNVKATFFCTGNFAEHAHEVMQRIMDEGHEVACHGVDHWQPKETDFVVSKQIVERVTGRTVYGYRQPRMFPVIESEIKKAGPCARAEDPKLLCLVFPRDSVYLVTLRAYLVHHAHLKATALYHIFNLHCRIVFIKPLNVDIHLDLGASRMNGLVDMNSILWIDLKIVVDRIRYRCLTRQTAR